MRIVLSFLVAAALVTGAHTEQRIVVGAKHFNEGYILGEIVAQSLEHAGIPVDRKFTLGGTLVCFEALRTGAVDVYPEYSGTLGEEILRAPRNADIASLRAILARDHNLKIAEPFGFNNTYAIAVRRDVAARLHLASIADLAGHPELRIAVSYEFLKREDGWAHVAGAYHLTQAAVGIEHGLAYQALADGKIDVTDVYSTDGEIPRYNLTLLRDDRHVFPSYLAITLYGPRLDATSRHALDVLSGTITDSAMQAMNARVVFEGATAATVAHDFLVAHGVVSATTGSGESTAAGEILAKTITHLELTAIALLIAIMIAVPLGVLLYRFRGAAQPVLYLTGLLQTIPSIALLALMIPLVGIGPVPAVIALCIYGLLPILRNTTSALLAVDPLLKNVATAIGLTPWQRLRYVEFPLSLPTIFAGVRTAAVINIGTATLAAFIGAGGLGEFIVTGLALNNTTMILKGAIPAAVLALMVEFLFERAERAFTPAHLRPR